MFVDNQLLPMVINMLIQIPGFIGLGFVIQFFMSAIVCGLLKDETIRRLEKARCRIYIAQFALLAVLAGLRLWYLFNNQDTIPDSEAWREALLIPLFIGMQAATFLALSFERENEETGTAKVFD